jgi:hypothetical protein
VLTAWWSACISEEEGQEGRAISFPRKSYKEKRSQFLLYSKKPKKASIDDMNCCIIDDKNQEQQREEERYDVSIFAVFEKVHDGRKAQRKRYPFSLLLILLSLGKMAGERTITGVVDWVKEREPWLKKQLNWPQRFPVVAMCTHARAHCDAQEGDHAMMCVLQKARKKQQHMAERDKGRSAVRRVFTETSGERWKNALRDTQPPGRESAICAPLLTL